MPEIVDTLEALEKGPMYHYELYAHSPKFGFIIHEMTDLGILNSQMEQNGKDKGYHRRYYISELGKQLLENRRKRQELKMITKNVAEYGSD